jgi:hypothetical protein
LAWWQEVERAYLLRKARQVADQQGSGEQEGEGGQEGEAGDVDKTRPLMQFALHGLKKDLFPELMELMRRGAGGTVFHAVPRSGGR